jgi:hypothetical protein
MAKAQFYLFAGIILASLVFLIASNSSFVEERGFDKTRSLVENYKHEGNIIVNNAIYTRKNISTELRNFTEYFIEHAKDKDITLKLIFLYNYQDEIHIVNYLKEPVIISANTIEDGEELSIAYAEELEINLGNESYEFSFNQQNTELITLFIGE